MRICGRVLSIVKNNPTNRKVKKTKSLITICSGMTPLCVVLDTTESNSALAWHYWVWLRGLQDTAESSTQFFFFYLGCYTLFGVSIKHNFAGIWLILKEKSGRILYRESTYKNGNSNFVREIEIRFPLSFILSGAQRRLFWWIRPWNNTSFVIPVLRVQTSDR